MPDDTKRVGPLTGRQWLLGAAGGVGAYLVYRWYKNRQASALGAATPGAGGTIPAGGPVSSTSPTPTTQQGWLQALLNFGNDPIATFNAGTNWLAGNCVDSGGYQGLVAAIESLGLPPGFTSPPALTVCTAGNPGSSPGGSGAGGSGSSGGGTSSSSAGGGSAAPTPNLSQALNAVPASLAAQGYVFNPTLGYDVPASLTYPEALYLQQHPGTSPSGAGFTPPPGTVWNPTLGKYIPQGTTYLEALQMQKQGA